jgi:nucleotide-binding universal stress UspA family protein
MKKILVPVDFSGCATNALNYALEVAKRSDAAVTVLHIIYPTQGLDNNVYNMFWDTYTEERKEALQELVAKFRKNTFFDSVRIDTVVEIGFPVESIRQYAQRHAADLIVMGTTGGSGISNLLFGSNTASIAVNTQIPLLAVPAKCDFRTHANFVLSTDFRLNLNDKSREALKTILGVQHSGLKVLNILDEPGEVPPADAETQVAKSLGDIPHTMHYLHDRAIEIAIRNFVESVEASGLVVVSHRHSFWYKIFHESVTRAMIQHLQLPILVLHDRV